LNYIDPMNSAALRIALSLALVCAGGLSAQASEPLFDRRPVPAEPRALGLDPHWHHGAFIEIFVRGWKDSDGDGLGDLRGLTQTLDSLKALGVRGIWLMPIQANADGDHGYATQDYRAVAREYGTLADFDELIREAGKRGIGVIMDYVLNHTAASHPAFVSARQGPQAPYRNWFVWSERMLEGWDIWGKNPWYQTSISPWAFKGEARDLPKPAADARDFYFGTFGPHMPDFDMRNPEVVAFHEDSLRFWLNRGLAGYRLDATPHLIERNAVDWNDRPESRALTKRLADGIRAYPGRYVVCEATARPQEWGEPAVCGGAFAFGYVHHFIGAALGRSDSVDRLAMYYRSSGATMTTFLSNHDIFAGRRLWDQLAERMPGADAATRTAAYKLAAAAYLLQPGTPFIYYGEDIGQAGVHEGLKGDMPLRAPYSWTGDERTAGFTTGQPFRPVAPNVATHNLAAQRADPGSIWNFYRAVIGLRNSRPSLARGEFVAARAEGLTLQFQRRLGNERTLVVVNYGEQPAEVEVSGLAPAAKLSPLLGAPHSAGRAVRASGSGVARVSLRAREVQVHRIDR
jgi:glycosidase